jgi:hypothetical protein
MMGEM